MASTLYDSYKQDILEATINLTSANIKVAMVDTGTYTFSAAHNFHDDLTGVVDTTGNLASKTVTSGVFDAADITVSAVTGNSIEALVVYEDSGVSATSPLIAFIDGLSITPDGSDISILWDAAGIFTIG